MENLQQALGDFLGESELIGKLAMVLAEVADQGSFSYEEARELAAEDTEDVLLLGYEWRLLLPIRTQRCHEWDDRMLLAEEGERYELPNIVRWLVEGALKTARWDSALALQTLFKVMREPEWELMPRLVSNLMERSQNLRVSAVQIGMSCRELALGDRVDSLIAELKGSGVMSPRLGSLADVVKSSQGPLYELNPCLGAMTRHQES